jgi:hypothetical protein
MLYDPHSTDRRPIVILDTSGLNRFADEDDSAALIDCVSAGFHLRLTFTSVCEVIATEDADRRRSLLEVCKRILRRGDCIDPQHEILRKMVRSFEANPSFDWTNVYVRFHEAEFEILRGEGFDDELSRQEREEGRALNKQFVQIFGEARAPFDRLFESSPETRPNSLADFVPHLKVPGGAFWILSARLCERASTSTFDETRVRQLLTQCDPFHTLMLALFAAEYERCIRQHWVTPSLRSGRNDTFMSVCLPYCHHFVTDDPGQLACFRTVSSIAGLNILVYSYDEFLDAIFISKSLVQTVPTKLVF